MSEFTQVPNKFIFTDEGKKQLVAQNNGIRFAVIGSLLISGLDTYETDEDFYNAYHTLTLEKLLDNQDIMIGMQGISYTSLQNGKITPVYESKYALAKSNLSVKSDLAKDYFINVRYIPTLELMDEANNYFGTYDVEFTQNTLEWDHKNNISFAHFVLIGKQYSETDDAVFNVAEQQEYVILGISQVVGKVNNETNTFDEGIQFLAGQNKYLVYKYQLRLTLTNDNDISTELNLETENAKEVIDWKKQISVTNDGLKTVSTVTVMGDTSGFSGHSIADDLDLDLNQNGTLSTTKTFMVADAYGADEAENQFNGIGLMHLINKKDSQDEYKPQLVMTTIAQPESYDDAEITAYSVGMSLRAPGANVSDVVFNNEIGAAAENISTVCEGSVAPVFKINSIPEYDDRIVDIYGFENKYLGETNTDKFLFSNKNNSIDPVDNETYGPNIVIASNSNTFKNGGANTDNLLIKSNNNVFDSESVSNLLMGSDNNLLKTTDANILLGTNYSTVSGNDAANNVILNSENIEIDNNSKNIIINGDHIKINKNDTNKKIIIGNYNNTAVSDADIIIANGTSENARNNAIEYRLSNNTLKFNHDGNNAVFSTDGMNFNNNQAVYDKTGISFDNDNVTYTKTGIQFDNGNTEYNAKHIYISEKTAVSGVDEIDITTTGITFNGDKTHYNVNELKFVDNNGNTAKFNSKGISLNNNSVTVADSGISVGNGKTVISNDQITTCNNTVAINKAGIANINNDASIILGTTNSGVYTKSGYNLANNKIMCNSAGMYFANRNASISIASAAVINTNGLKLGNNIYLNETGLLVNNTNDRKILLQPQSTSVAPGLIWYNNKNEINKIGSTKCNFSCNIYWQRNDVDDWSVSVQDIRDDYLWKSSIKSVDWLYDVLTNYALGLTKDDGNPGDKSRYYNIDINSVERFADISDSGTYFSKAGKIMYNFAPIPDVYDNVEINIFYVGADQNDENPLFNWIPKSFNKAVNVKVNIYMVNSKSTSVKKETIYFWQSYGPYKNNEEPTSKVVYKGYEKNTISLFTTSEITDKYPQALQYRNRGWYINY